MRRDVGVMTTTCDHHKERGLNCSFWDRCFLSCRISACQVVQDRGTFRMSHLINLLPKCYGSSKTISSFPVIDENRSIRDGRALQSNFVKTVMGCSSARIGRR